MQNKAVLRVEWKENPKLYQIKNNAKDIIASGCIIILYIGQDQKSEYKIALPYNIQQVDDQKLIYILNKYCGSVQLLLLENMKKDKIGVLKYETNDEMISIIYKNKMLTLFHKVNHTSIEIKIPEVWNFMDRMEKTFVDLEKNYEIPASMHRTNNTAILLKKIQEENLKHISEPSSHIGFKFSSSVNFGGHIFLRTTKGLVEYVVRHEFDCMGPRDDFMGGLIDLCNGKCKNTEAVGLGTNIQMSIIEDNLIQIKVFHGTYCTASASWPCDVFACKERIFSIEQMIDKMHNKWLIDMCETVMNPKTKP